MNTVVTFAAYIKNEIEFFESMKDLNKANMHTTKIEKDKPFSLAPNWLVVPAFSCRLHPFFLKHVAPELSIRSAPFVEYLPNHLYPYRTVSSRFPKEPCECPPSREATSPASSTIESSP